jgi:hypothetical protein
MSISGNRMNLPPIVQRFEAPSLDHATNPKILTAIDPLYNIIDPKRRKKHPYLYEAKDWNAGSEKFNSTAPALCLPVLKKGRLNNWEPAPDSAKWSATENQTGPAGWNTVRQTPMNPVAVIEKVYGGMKNAPYHLRQAFLNNDMNIMYEFAHNHRSIDYLVHELESIYKTVATIQKVPAVLSQRDRDYVERLRGLRNVRNIPVASQL